MHSCLYQGRVQHRRFRPVEHQFGYSLFMLYLDLDELPELERLGLLARETRSAAASFSRADYIGGDKRISPADAVKSLVSKQTGMHLAGPVRLLCQLRYFGYFFSPLNLYYCFAPDGETLQAVVAEVNNIPWRERHWYVLWSANQLPAGGDEESAPAGNLHFRHPKEFHVSPFMDMHQDYLWHLQAPGERLFVHLESVEDADDGDGTIIDNPRFFFATLTLTRSPLTRRHLAWAMFRQGWMSVKVVTAIYYEALKLWIKKCPSFSHPKDIPQTLTRHV